MNKENLKEWLKDRGERMTSEKSFIDSKIDAWLEKINSSTLSSNDVKQKSKELIDLGEFILCFDERIQIIDGICESPDFIISHDSRIVGVELADLVIRVNEKEKEGWLRKIFNQIEIELKENLTDYNGIYRVDIVRNILLNRHNQEVLKSEIIHLIKENISSCQLVSGVRKSYHTDVHIYSDEGCGVGSLERSIVEKIILKKNVKAENYISDKFEEVWLLLTTSGIRNSDDYSFIHEDVLNESYKTKFNRIFLLNFFDSSYVELKTCTD